jgi:hypothetical protein
MLMCLVRVVVVVGACTRCCRCMHQARRRLEILTVETAKQPPPPRRHQRFPLLTKNRAIMILKNYIDKSGSK